MYWLLSLRLKTTASYRVYKDITRATTAHAPGPSLMDELRRSDLWTSIARAVIARFAVGATPACDGVADVNAERCETPPRLFVERTPAGAGDELVSWPACTRQLTGPAGAWAR